MRTVTNSLMTTAFFTIIADANKVETFEPSQVKLYFFENVRNTKVVDLISSMLAATQNQTLNNKAIKNYKVEVLRLQTALS